MATMKGAELGEVIVDSGESAKSLNRPGLQRLLTLVNGRQLDAVIVANLDRLTRSVKDLRAQDARLCRRIGLDQGSSARSPLFLKTRHNRRGRGRGNK
jgi:DNA invertase Pin-like site-specific DNA recombinase